MLSLGELFALLDLRGRRNLVFLILLLSLFCLDEWTGPVAWRYAAVVWMSSSIVSGCACDPTSASVLSVPAQLSAVVRDTCEVAGDGVDGTAFVTVWTGLEVGLMLLDTQAVTIVSTVETAESVVETTSTEVSSNPGSLMSTVVGGIVIESVTMHGGPVSALGCGV